MFRRLFEGNNLDDGKKCMTQEAIPLRNNCDVAVEITTPTQHRQDVCRISSCSRQDVAALNALSHL